MWNLFPEFVLKSDLNDTQGDNHIGGTMLKIVSELPFRAHRALLSTLYVLFSLVGQRGRPEPRLLGSRTVVARAQHLDEAIQIDARSVRSGCRYAPRVHAEAQGDSRSAARLAICQCQRERDRNANIIFHAKIIFYPFYPLNLICRTDKSALRTPPPPPSPCMIRVPALTKLWRGGGLLTVYS